MLKAKEKSVNEEIKGGNRIKNIESIFKNWLNTICKNLTKNYDPRMSMKNFFHWLPNFALFCIRKIFLSFSVLKARVGMDFNCIDLNKDALYFDIQNYLLYMNSNQQGNVNTIV